MQCNSQVINVQRCLECLVADIRSRAEASLGGETTEGCRVHLVRDVAPNKRMFCISFQLPKAIAFRQKAGLGTKNGGLDPSRLEGNACKRQRTDATDATQLE